MSGEYEVRDVLAVHPRRRHVRRVQGRIWPVAGLRHGPAWRCSGRHRGQSAQALRPADGPLQFGGVMYVDSAEKPPASS